VAVNHEVRLPAYASAVATLWRDKLLRRGKSWGLGDDNGMAGSGAQARVEADSPAMVHEPAGAGAQILFVLRLRGDAGEAEVIAQFRHEAGLVAFQVIEHDLHGV